MRRTAIVCLLTVMFLVNAVGVAAAADWVYVGKLQLASGKSRTDYVDRTAVIFNKAERTLTFWVLSETYDPERPANMSVWKTTKYLTKLDGIYPTRVLEWRGYSKINGKVMEMSSTIPDNQIIYPDEFSLLGEAIEIAERYAK